MQSIFIFFELVFVGIILNQIYKSLYRFAGGFIVVKENVTSSGEVERDDEDSSVTRPPEVLR